MAGNHYVRSHNFLASPRSDAIIEFRRERTWLGIEFTVKVKAQVTVRLHRGSNIARRCQRPNQNSMRRLLKGVYRNDPACTLNRRFRITALKGRLSKGSKSGEIGLLAISTLKQRPLLRTITQKRATVGGDRNL